MAALSTKQELVKVAEGFFEKEHDKDKVRRIGEWRQAIHRDMMASLPDGTAVNRCTDAEVCRALLDRIIDRAGDLEKMTLMDPVLFFYAVAMAEEIFEREPGILLFEGDKERAADPGRRAKILPRHMIYLYLWYAKTNVSQDSIAIQAGIGQKTVSRYIAIAKGVLERVLPTPRKYDEHIKRQSDLLELKKFLPGPGRGTCIEDGTLCRMKRPGQKIPRDASYTGRKKAYMSNTLVRFNARGEAISATPTVEGTINDITLAKKYGLDLGIATEKLLDPDAPPEDRITRIDDTEFRGIEKVEPGAVYLRTVGRKKYQEMDKKGKAENRKIAVQRLPAEWFFGRVKRRARMREAYPGTYSEFSDEFNIIAGLENLHLMAGGVKKGSGHAKGPVGERKRRHRRDLDQDRWKIRMEEPAMEDWVTAP